jgi:hypothetical protein
MTVNVANAYGDIDNIAQGTPAQVGPTVTVNISQSGTALVTLTATMFTPFGNPVGGPAVQYAMSFDATPAGISCATMPGCIQANDRHSLMNTYSGAGTFDFQASATFLMTGLTPGSNVFQAKYECAALNVATAPSESCTFVNNTIMVTPY